MLLLYIYGIRSPLGKLNKSLFLFLAVTAWLLLLKLPQFPAPEKGSGFMQHHLGLLKIQQQQFNEFVRPFGQTVELFMANLSACSCSLWDQFCIFLICECYKTGYS